MPSIYKRGGRGWDAHNEQELPGEHGRVGGAALPSSATVPSGETAPGFGVCLNPEPFWDFTSQLLAAVVKRHGAACARDGTPAWGLRHPGSGGEDRPGKGSVPSQDDGV